MIAAAPWKAASNLCHDLDALQSRLPFIDRMRPRFRAEHSVSQCIGWKDVFLLLLRRMILCWRFDKSVIQFKLLRYFLTRSGSNIPYKWNIWISSMIVMADSFQKTSARGSSDQLFKSLHRTHDYHCFFNIHIFLVIFKDNQFRDLSVQTRRQCWVRRSSETDSTWMDRQWEECQVFRLVDQARDPPGSKRSEAALPSIVERHFVSQL